MDTKAKMTEMLEFSNSLSSSYYKMTQQTIINTLETDENVESLNEELKDIKRKQVDILQLKDTIAEIKNSPYMLCVNCILIKLEKIRSKNSVVGFNSEMELN